MEYRVEVDSIGEIKVPKGAYFGAQTWRAVHNFHITGYHTHPAFVKGLAYVKKATSLANAHAGVISKEIADVMVQASEEILEGKFDDQFITDVIQGGAGKSVN